MRHPHDKAESRFNTDTGISKEDEERYKKLVLENEELQKLIAQVRMTNDIYIHSIVPINLLLIFLLNLSWQKEDKIRILKQRLAERDQQKGDTQSSSQLQISQHQTNGGSLGLNQGKDGVQIILPEQTTTSDFDSAFGNGFSISVCTRSTDIEFSESYL